MAKLTGKRPAIALALTLVLALALAACGSSGAKRSVDARSEVFAFYGKGAPAVVLIHPQPPADLLELNRVASGLPEWERLRADVLGPLHDAGLSSRRLRVLTRPSDELEGVESSALALGAAQPEDLADGRRLLVLATDQSELLSDYLRQAVSAGKVERAGTLEGANLFEAREFSFAERDGVLVSAASLGEVRDALLRRDGDSDEQLDADFVQSLFSDLSETGPLLVYADLDRVRDADPGLRELAETAPWTGQLGPVAASAQADSGKLEIEAVSKANGDLTSSGTPWGSEPSPIEVATPQAGSLIPPGPSAALLAGLTPFAGEATATSDELRLHLTAGG